MASEVVTVMEQFRRALLNAERSQVGQMARRWLQIERLLDAQITALVADMNAAKRNGRPVNGSTLFQMERYQALLLQLNRELDRFGEEVADQITARSRNLAQAGIQQAGRAISAVTGPSLTTGFNILPVDAVIDMVGIVADGTPLGIWLTQATLKAEMAAKVSDALIRGTALGWNPRKTARAVKDAFSGGLQRALNTARTVQLQVMRESFRAQMQASGLVSGYRRLASKSVRTCMACLMDDGRLYPIEQPMPEHNQGRCTSVPVIEGFPPVQWQQGRDWFIKQDANTQRQMLGDGRYEAHKAKKFDLDQLITTRRDAVWGDSLQVTALNVLVPV